MEDIIATIVNIGFFVFLLGIGYFIGSMVEKKHLAYLDQREEELKNIAVSNLRTLPPNWRATDPQLVAGVCVIATDYFKTFASGVRSIFGGRVRSLETLVERARRQAVVRMLEAASGAGANVVWNVRIDTMTIGNQQGKTSAVEVLASGTAYRVE